MDRNNLDSELSNLIREAAEWKTTERDRTTDDSLLERDACLTALANAITNYVTVEITRRLTVPSEPTPPSFNVSNNPIWGHAKTAKRTVSRPTDLNATKTTTSTPTTHRRSGSLNRLNKTSQPSTPLEEDTPLKMGPRYRSENRLDRFSPSPRPNETPLENKASRLRRLSTERRSLRK